MAKFYYTAYAADGSHNTKLDSVIAADRKEAEKLIQARYNYPVRIAFLEDTFKELDVGSPMFPMDE